MANWCFKMLVNSINASATSHTRQIKKIYLQHIPRSIVQWLPNKYIAYACCTLWYMIIETWITNETLISCIMENITWNSRTITLRNIKSNTIFWHNTLIYNYGKKPNVWQIIFMIWNHLQNKRASGWHGEPIVWLHEQREEPMKHSKNKKKDWGQNMRLDCSSKESEGQWDTEIKVNSVIKGMPFDC